MEEPLASARKPTESVGHISAAYVQDSWRPLPNLTVKPGVRLDVVTLDNSVGEQVADMDRSQPRLGVAWDLFGDARHVVRGSWGRFMDSTALSIPNLASGVVQAYRNYVTMELRCASLVDPDNCNVEYLDTHGSFGTHWDYVAPNGTEWVLWNNPSAASVYDPAWTEDQAGVGKLQAPYSDELVLAYETQPFSDSSVEVIYVDKKTKQLIEDTCVNNTWVYDHSVPYPTLADPSTWTSGAGCTRYLLANHDSFYRHYEGYALKLETRKERYHLLASYTHSTSRGNSPSGSSQAYATELADYYPVHFYNQDGYLPDDRRHRVKVNGYLLLPYDLTIALDGFWSSPGRVTKIANCASLASASDYDLAFYGLDDAFRDQMVEYCNGLSTSDISLEPRGNTETKSLWQLDLQVTKGFRVGAVSLEAILTVENLFDREMEATFDARALRQERDPVTNRPLVDADGNKVWAPVLQPTSYTLPRRYEVGIRVEF